MLGRCIYYDKGIAGYDMESTKIKKNVICTRKYGKFIKQFAANLTSQVIPFSLPPPLVSNYC